jgi:hypothetical protein
LREFAVTMRSEVDLEQLSEQLQDAVQESMHPERVSLWLRPLAQPTSESGEQDAMTLIRRDAPSSSRQ